MTQLPPLSRRPVLPDPRKRLRPKTYSVAVYLVLAVGLLELGMLVSVFWLRALVVSVNTGLPKPHGGLSGASYVPPPLHPNGPANPPVDSTGVPRLTVGLSATPALLKVPSPSDKQEQVTLLNEEAHVFLRQNDYPSALDLLVKAEDIDPRSPITLKTMAETYNLTNNPVMAKIYWQRIVDLGAGVGTVYAEATDHVLLLDSGRDANPLHDPSTLPRQLYVDSVQKSPVETRNGAAQFEVHAVIRRKDAKMANFEQKKLQPYVIFYQLMPDGSLVPDLGQRKGAFEDTFLFWGDKQSESFSVTYVMPIPGTPGPNGSTQGEYYGFVIGLYYDKTLQDVRSEPSDLCTRMALPQEIE